MTSAADTIQAIQNALEPYVRPREEAEHIRRVLALHLRSGHENGPETGPLALVDPECTIKSTSDVRGLQREYLKALHANIKAQREYGAASQQAERTTKLSSPSSLNDANRLEQHVATIKLRRKQERLQTVEKYLDLLSKKPAASDEFTQPEEILKNTRRLPEVPKTVVSSFTIEKGSTKSDLKALVDRLEKSVLRSKLLLKKEEQLLEEVKSQSTVSPGKVSGEAKLAALNATRHELISWMEMELSKASEPEEPHPQQGGDIGRSGPRVNKDHMDEQLTLIKEKYASYVAARKTLIRMVDQSPPPSIKSPEEAKTAARPEKVQVAPSTHLITPYIENLLSVAQEQKTSIAQKSHLGNVVSKQTEEAGRALDRLAEESQLLPDHHPRTGRIEGFSDRSGKGSHRITDHVQPWVSAADAAKLATLEVVAERIEAGQVALEASTKHLAEIDQLLGRNKQEETPEDDITEDDIWLAETQTPRKGSKGHVRNKSEAVREPKNVWLTLDGSLGLINAEDSPRK